MPVPSLYQITTALEQPPTQRYEQWFLPLVSDFEARPPDTRQRQDFHGQVTSLSTGSSALHDVHSDDFQGAVTRRHRRGDFFDKLALVYVMEGQVLSRYEGDTERVTGAGQFLLFDARHPNQMQFHQPHFIQVNLPRSRLRGVLSDRHAPSQLSRAVTESGLAGILGAALGYVDQHIRLPARNSRANVDSYSVSVYGGRALPVGAGTLQLILGGAYGHHRIRTHRQARIADWSDTLETRYRGHTTQLFGEAAYAFAWDDHAVLEPFASLAWIRQRVQGFSESGGRTALSGQGQTHHLGATILGVRAATQWQTGHRTVRAHGTLGWRHTLGRLSPRRHLVFDASPSFEIQGTPLARDSVVLELGLDVALSRNARMGLTYGGQWGRGSRDHGASVDVQWRF